MISSLGILLIRTKYKKMAHILESDMVKLHLFGSINLFIFYQFFNFSKFISEAIFDFLEQLQVFLLIFLNLF